MNKLCTVYISTMVSYWWTSKNLVSVTLQLGIPKLNQLKWPHMKRGNIFRDKGRNFKGLSTERKKQIQNFWKYNKFRENSTHL